MKARVSLQRNRHWAISKRHSCSHGIWDVFRHLPSGSHLTQVLFVIICVLLEERGKENTHRKSAMAIPCNSLAFVLISYFLPGMLLLGLIAPCMSCSSFSYSEQGQFWMPRADRYPSALYQPLPCAAFPPVSKMSQNCCSSTVLQ